ncbi:MAG TPA: hypothetical protein VK207_02110 [Bacteroidales bacterium]|nr:hypothetical protein [Bacteroidales bacterium]
MEEFYQIHNDGGSNKFIVIRKKHPDLMAYIEQKGKHLEISKLNLLENCDISALSKALSEMEHHLKMQLLPEKSNK